MATTDPLLEALGFEGFIVEESSVKPKLPTGFEGFVFTESSPIAKQPTGFEGFLIEYRPNEKYIKIETSRGKPLIGCEVTVTQSVPFTAVTDVNGLVFGVFDVAGTLDVRIKSGNTYYDYTINAASQPLTTTFIFPLHYND